MPAASNIAAEAAQAKEWRERRGLSVNQLADMTGYAPVTVYWFERGIRPPNRGKDQEIREWVWLRFKMACAGVEKQLRSGKEFRW